MKDAPRGKRPPEASSPLTKVRVLAAVAKPMLPKPSNLLRNVEFPLRAPSVPSTVEPPAKAKRTGADYDTEWARRPAVVAARRALQESLVRPLVHAVADPEVAGIDRLEHVSGPVIFAANHHSHLDTPVLLAALPLRFRRKVFVVAAADYFFTNHLTSAASAFALNAIPLERVKVSRRASDHAAELLDDGWNMAIFPEGGRSPDGWGQPFRAGGAFLAVKTNTPVVPVHLWGTDRLLPKGANRLKRGSTVVTFGEPLRPAAGEDARHFGTRIEAAVAALGDEATSDWYSARKRAHAGTTPGLGGPDIAPWRRTWALGERDPHHRNRRKGDARRWPSV